MKTYHTYFGDSQQAETKLRRAESQRVKSDQAAYTVIGRRFRRDYDKLSEKVNNFLTSVFALFWLNLIPILILCGRYYRRPSLIIGLLVLCFYSKTGLWSSYCKSQPIWIQFCTHLLLYGIHSWADLDCDQRVGGFRPNQNDYVFL